MNISRDLDTESENSLTCKRHSDSVMSYDITKTSLSEFSSRLQMKVKASPVQIYYREDSESSSGESSGFDYSSFVSSNTPSIPKPEPPTQNEKSYFQQSTFSETKEKLQAELRQKRITINRKKEVSSQASTNPTPFLNKPVELTNADQIHEVIVLKETVRSEPVRSTIRPKEFVVKDFIPFTVKYAPKTLDSIVSNSSQAKTVFNWLKSYADSSENSWFKSATKKVALISGPPGTGKTTAARVISNLLNLRIIELNASDCRNKSFIQEKIAPFVNNTSIVSTKKVGKAVLLMDEVDGMSTGDEGGISALIECIQVSKVPIICICNDRFSPGIKSLVKFCIEIKFNKPFERDCMKVLDLINKEEKLGLRDDQVKSIAGYCRGDLRFALNMMECCRNEFYQGGSKDAMVSMNAFETTGLFLSASKSGNVELDEKLSMFLADHEFISMLIVENYIDVVKFEELAEASEGLILSDLLMRRIKTGQEWTLLPDFAFACLYTASFSEQNSHYPKFPKTSGGKKKGKDSNKELSESEKILNLLNKII